MTESTQNSGRYLADDLVIDAGTREVRRADELLELPGLSFDLLLALVRAAPNVLSHDDLEELVWAGRPVSPETVTQRVKLVRDALGDSSDSPRYITVVRGRGYRLLATVSEVDAEMSGVAAAPAPARKSLRLVILVPAVTVLVTVFWAVNHNEDPVYQPGPRLDSGTASIAVLAFDDLSENRDQEYFSDAMSETLIHELAQVSGLKVIAKSSAFYFKGKDARITDIAGELGVGHVLDGSVQRAGNRVRVTAQLIDASDNSSVWIEHFDRDLVDLFAVQDEIAREVVEALRVTLLDAEDNRLAQRYRPSLEAYEQVILGRVERNQRSYTVESMAAEERHFQRAIEIDPGYALAYVELARTYKFQVNSFGLLTEDSIERRQRLLEKALELDPFSAEAHAARAVLHSDRGQPGLAERDYLEAIRLNPGYASAYRWYAILLMRQGRPEEALAQARVAAELDPVTPYVQNTLALALWIAGRAEEAQTVTRRNIDRHPEIPSEYSQMANYSTVLGNLGEAQWWHDEARKLNPAGPDAWRWRCMGFLQLGDELSAANCVAQLSAAHPDTLDTAYARHGLQVYQGNYDAAIATSETIMERLPGQTAPVIFLADLLAGEGDIRRARQLIVKALPELLENEVELAATDLGAALTLAAILHAGGEIARRDVLLAAMEARIATMHRTRGYGYGVADVYIHALRGDRDRAIAALREATEVGWKSTPFSSPWIYWWQLPSDWKLANLRQDPEFIALLNELETDVLEQRQWYEQHKGKPLF